jgi:hypothetical protein
MKDGLYFVAGYDKMTKSGRVVVAHNYCKYLGDKGYGVWILCENYSAGRMVKTWRYKSTGLTKEQAIKRFDRVKLDATR